MGRTATGVRGIRLVGDDNKAIGMVCVPHDDATLLVVSAKGYGKRSSVGEYRITKRGGKGVKAMNVTDKTGSLVAIKGVVDTDDLMIINKSGIAIRLAVDGLRVMGRATQGVRLIRINEGDAISSVAKIEKMVDDELVEDTQETDENTDNTDNKQSESSNDNQPSGDGDESQPPQESGEGQSSDEDNE
jgi:DNA gyrase subunit A